MKKQPDTVKYYNEHAEEFIEGTVNVDMGACLCRFVKYVPAGGLILDAGCGSGRDAAHFLEMGYRVEAFDASENICKRAAEYIGVPVKCMRFEEFEESQHYDGIWACASLLHVKRECLPDAVERLRNGLKDRGILYMSFKKGCHEREKSERYFNDQTAESLQRLIADVKMELLECFETVDARPGRSDERWVSAVCRKAGQEI